MNLNIYQLKLGIHELLETFAKTIELLYSVYNTICIKCLSFETTSRKNTFFITMV